MSAPPTGTVTFLFTDIEGSTKLAQAHPSAWETARLRHHAILQQAIDDHHGHVFQIIGDAFCAAFHTAPDALAASLDAQHALQAEPWGETPIRVRMGLHTGTATLRSGGDYEGYLALATVQRVMSIAYGGQTLVSNATAGLLASQLPEAVTLRDMGEQRLKSLLNPEHLWQVVAPDLPADFPPLQSLNTIPNNLPIQVTSFVGRESELADLKPLLRAHRLLTLTGSGGAGKTRLALHLAADLLDGFADGVWLIELAPLTDPALLPITVATVLGVRAEQSRPLLATLQDWLRPKCLLLVLDNCEHMIEACASFADAVLHAGRDLHVLATSREALGIAGEAAWRVPSLAVPGAQRSAAGNLTPELMQYASIQLFVERAAQANASFRLTEANVPAVAQICYRLDGIPLAIEFAAARVKAMRVEQIAERLDDRFRLLTGGSRTALPRQQTLRGTLDWSHSLLPEAERVVLRRLSVFAGGWSFEAAESVCAGSGIERMDVLDLLTHLVDKSLVVLDEQSAEPRYRMLETVRQYAREKLLDAGEGDTIRDQHLALFVHLAERTERLLLTTERTTWLPRLEVEHDNLRAGLEWACERDIETARWLAGVLYWFWRLDDHLNEARAWYIRVLEAGKPETATKGLAAAIFGLGATLVTLDSEDAARPKLVRCVALWRILGDPWRLAWSLFFLAYLSIRYGESKDADDVFSENESLFRGSGDPGLLVWAISCWGLALVHLRHDEPDAQKRMDEALALARIQADPQSLFLCYMNLGERALLLNDLAAARFNYLEALRWRRQLGTRWMIVIGLWQAADTMCLQDDYGQAGPLFEEALFLTRALGDQRNEADLLRALASVSLHQGDLEHAASLLANSLASFRQWADMRGIALCLAIVADLRRAQSHIMQAVRLLGYVCAWTQSNAQKVTLFEQIAVDRTLIAARAAFDPATFDVAWTAGRALTLDQAIALALEEPHA